MRELTAEPELNAFAPPTEFDLTTYLAATFGPHAGTELHHVRIRFDGYAAPYIREHTFHPSQRIEPAADDTDGIEVHMTVNHLLDIQRWVLSWGRHAKVIGPPQLRQQIEAELETMTASYHTGPAPQNSA